MVLEQKKILAYKFLNRFNDLQRVIKDGDVYYVDKDGKPLFFHYQNIKNGTIWVNYDRIWSFFEEFFLMEYKEIQGILKDWLEETYNLRGFTPGSNNQLVWEKLEETYNLRGFTPDAINLGYVLSRWKRPIK